MEKPSVETLNSGAVSRPSWLPESLFPFESRFVEVGDARLHYIDEGTGPVLLFLHGNPTYSFGYRNVIKSLRDRFRCIAVDYPGFGLSQAPEGYEFTPQEHATVLEGFIEKLDLTDVTMMVKDWGGPIGLQVAVRRPERFRAFIIGNSWAWPLNDQLRLVIFSTVMGGPVGRFLIAYFNIFVNIVIPWLTHRVKLGREVMRAYRGPFPTPKSRRPIFIFPKDILRARPFLANLENRLACLRNRPVLFVWGDEDFAFTENERKRFAGHFPDHKTVILKGASHYILEDAPDEIADAIRAWYPTI